MVHTTTTPTATANPAAMYLAHLSEGSQGMRQVLDAIAGILSDRSDATTFPWWNVTYRESVIVRTALAARYKPTTTNKMLSALRGVLKETWRLGLIDVDAYRRAADVENVRATTLLSGRALGSGELKQLFATCAADSGPAGRRDAAMLGVLYGAGLRRGELAGLDIDDFDEQERSLRIRRGKGRKQRTVYLTATACRLVRVWLDQRGDELGAMFCPIDQKGRIRISRLRGGSLAYILRRRQQQADTESFSAHDLRRTAITDLLNAGVDVFTVQKLVDRNS